MRTRSFTWLSLCLVAALLMIVAGAWTGPAALAHGTVDQHQDVATTPFFPVDYSAQTFTPTANHIVGVDLNFVTAGSYDVQIRASCPGTTLGSSGFISVGTGEQHIHFSSTIALTPGTKYCLRVFDNTDVIGDRSVRGNVGYAGGGAVDNPDYGSGERADVDWFFRTYFLPPEPETAIDSAVDGNSTSVPNNGSTLSTSITFSFSGTDDVGVTGFECSLDNATFTLCSSPQTYSSLSLTAHTFRVRAKDGDGHADQSPASHTWTVGDTTPPSVAITSAVAPLDGLMPSETATSFPAVTVGAQPITLSGTVDDDIGVASVQVNGTNATVTTKAWSLAGVSLATGDNTLTVIATDTAGNSRTVTATVTLSLDLDSDGVRNNIDGNSTVSQARDASNKRFSDKLLGGKTSGTLTPDAGSSFVIADSSSAAEGVSITVLSGKLQVKLDGKGGTHTYIGPASGILTDPDELTTIHMISGEDSYALVIGGATVTVVVGAGETASVTETVVDGKVESFTVSAVEGIITVGSQSLRPGENLAGPIPVGIDILPGGTPNTINPTAKGTVPVAILSTPTFNAFTQVKKAPLGFGRTGSEASLIACNKAAEDVNGDGLKDLICKFDATKTGFKAGDTQGVLTGGTTDGIPIRGKDTVRITTTSTNPR